MANIFNGFLDNLVNGALSPKGDMADYSHAARLFTDDNFRLAPKQKFLYHVTLNLNDNVVNKVLPGWVGRHTNEVNMLVKSVTMPSYDITTETKNKYNRKKNVQTRIDYSPVNIVFHDDNNSITTQLWTAYYNYMFRDGTYGSRDGAGAPNQSARPYDRFNTYKGSTQNGDRFGLDNNQYEPFFTSIQISQLARHQYLTLTLVNPIIEKWSHDTLDNSASAEPVQNTMTVAYESVFYADGAVVEGSTPKGFATEHYDSTPSPIAAGSGGSLFGSSGVLAGGVSVLGDLAGGKADLGTLLTAARTVKNAKKLTKEGLRNEAYQVAGQTIRTATGTNVSGLANTSFPKSGGNGTQTTEAKAITTVKQNKQIDTAELQTALDNNAELKDLVAERAVAIGAVSTLAGYNIGNAAGLGAYDNLTVNEKTIVKTEVDQLLSNEDPKMLSITNSIVTKYRESQAGSSTIAAQKNPLGNV
jgi:hypothetical protein